MKKFLRFTTLVLVLVLMTSTLSLSADNGINRNPNILNISSNEPEGLDPQLITSDAASIITNSIMEGLMRRNGKNIIPGIASRYEVSKDGLTYTFYLRDAVWTDGKPVTAQDFAYAWQRALDPKTACDYAFIMYYIKNGEKYNLGKVDKSQLGIKVLNAKTLQVILENPTPYFIDLTSNVTYLPARQDIVEKYKDAYFSGPEYTVSNGPFKLTEWEHDEYITVAKNATYWNANKIKVDEINAYMYGSTDSIAEGYKRGELDVITLSNDRKDISSTEKINYFTGTSWYIQFNNIDKTGILSNVNIRKALTLSINRQEFIKQSNTSQALAALSLVAPEIIPGKSKSFREEAGDLIKDNDLKAAKEALNLGLKQLKLKKLPSLVFIVDDSDTGIKKAEVLAQMWKKNLGVDIKVEAIQFKDRLEKMHSGNYQIALAGWGPDYSDALTYLEMFDSSAKPNSFGYKNTDFNNLVKSIKNELDKSKRIDLLKKAEKKIIDDYAVAPLYFRYDAVAVKPYIKNLPINAIGAKYDFTSIEMIEGGKPFTTKDSKLTIKANPYWSEEKKDDVELEIIDWIEEASLTVTSSDGPISVSDLENVYNEVVKEMEETFDKANFSDKTISKASGFPTLKFRLNTEEEGVKISFSYVIISGPEKVYQVMLWAETDVFEQRKAEFDKMLQSISIKK